MNIFMKLKTIFFDCDGVLYNSLPHYVTAWSEAFEEIGLEFPEKEAYRHEGRNGKEAVRIILKQNWSGKINDDIVKKIISKRNDVLERLGKPNLQEGAIELVTEVKKSGLDIWVVTGSSRTETFKMIVEDFYGLIDKKKIITGKDVRRGKPNPEPFLTACLKANISPCEAIVIENAPLGIESAHKAGILCIAVNTGILTDFELENAGAKIVFDSCINLLINWKNILDPI